jgi:hypothetical protein
MNNDQHFHELVTRPYRVSPTAFRRRQKVCLLFVLTLLAFCVIPYIT